MKTTKTDSTNLSQPPKDRRTREYKEWKANYDKQTKGLGDTVEKITEATGIKKAVKFIAGENCGCDSRKKFLNQIFPYKKPECFTEEEYNYLTPMINGISQMTYEQRKEVINIYNRIFNSKVKVTTCSTCINGYLNELKKVYNQYE